MPCNWLIYLVCFLLAPTILPAISYHKRNYDLRYANSDVPQWKQRACQKSQREKINLHYICDEKGNVKCLPGWQGDLCQVPQCRKGCDPMNGYCQRPDECRCRIGYTGEFCERCIPLPGCQHGYCNKPFECICKPGWDGLFCTEPTCRSSCHSTRGYCETPGECRCRLGWAGHTCSDCAVLPGCQHGTCQKPLECNCLPGYTGLLCQTAICATGCHKQRGYCAKPGECRCKVGWTGANCDQCFPYPGCVNGDCKRPWECNCKTGWGGILCDEKLSYCDEHPSTCENGGRCISFTRDDGNYRCECKQGYLGKNCEILDEFMLTSTSAPRITPPPMPNWEAEAENNNESMADDDDDDEDVSAQLVNKTQQNNAVATATKIIDNNVSNITATTESALPQTQFNSDSVVSTAAALDKLTNLNDTKSIVVSDSNNMKSQIAATQADGAEFLSKRNTSITNVTSVAPTATATAAAIPSTRLNLINASVPNLKSHNTTFASLQPDQSFISTKSTHLTAHRPISNTSPRPLTIFSSPMPIPLHFHEIATHNNNNKKVTNTDEAFNSNLVASAGDNAANKDTHRVEYEEDDDDDDDEEGDDDDEEDDDGDDDDDEDDVDQLIPDVLNNVA